MPSIYETLGLIAFASRVPAIFVRRKVRRYLLSKLDPDGALKRKSDDLVERIDRLERRPDAVAILNAEQSVLAGLPAGNHILFVEVEHTSPLTAKAVGEYAELHESSFESELPHSIAVAIVDQYGSVRFVDLAGMCVAAHFINAGGITETDGIDAHTVREQMGY